MIATRFTQHDSLRHPCEFDSLAEQRRPEQHVFDDCIAVNPIKTRSGLATLAGFAGLALVFSKFSLAAFIWSMFPRVIDTSSPEGAALSKLFLVLIPLPGLVAPVSLWLGMWAWSDLSRHREKSGRLQAGFALIVGLLGTIVVLAEMYQVAKVFFLG